MATKWQTKRWVGLGKRCDVSMYIPSQRIIEIADERTRGLLEYFLEVTRVPCDYRLQLGCLERLVRSAYLQGANDTAVAAAKLIAGEIDF